MEELDDVEKEKIRKKITNRKIYLGICISIMLFILLGWVNNIFNDEESVKAEEVYLYSQVNNDLEAVNIKVDYEKSESELLVQMFDKLKAGAEEQSLSATVPAYINVVSYNMSEGDVLEIVFDDTYNELSKWEELNMRSSIVWSFTSLDFVKGVSIKINDKYFVNNKGEAIELFDRTNIVMNPKISPEKVSTATLTLYFKIKDTYNMGAELREVYINQDEIIEKYVVDEIIKGTTNSNYGNSFPTDTKIKKVYTEDYICYVDFGPEFLKINWSSAGDESVAIYSLVNSLTEFSHIKKVQFLIDSKKYNEFGTMDLSQPFERNEEYIQ